LLGQRQRVARGVLGGGVKIIYGGRLADEKKKSRKKIDFLPTLHNDFLMLKS